MRALVLLFGLLLPLAPRLQAQAYTPSHRNPPSGTEMVAVFITADFCLGSRQPGLPQAIERMKQHLHQTASVRGQSFSTTGVALDWEVDMGVAHLRKFGAFDEIAVGRNWFGAGAIQYVWRDLPGPAATPQVLVFERTVASGQNGMTFGQPRLLLRLVGSGEIVAWAERGAPLSS